MSVDIFVPIVISLIGHTNMRSSEMIIVLEKNKITPEIRNKLVKKGLTLIGMSDKEMIFSKSIRYFL